MSDVRDPETDQAAPTVVAGQPFIQDLVIQDIEARKQHGITKYGTALQAGNGRSMLKDAYDEVLDLAIYLRGMIEEERLPTWKMVRAVDGKEELIAEFNGSYKDAVNRINAEYNSHKDREVPQLHVFVPVLGRYVPTEV